MSTPNIIPTNSDSLFSVLDSLTTLEKQAIIRPLNPPPGIAGYLFDIPEEEEINLRSTITDHFVERNTTINDQIALNAEEFTVRGLVAELARIPPTREDVSRIADALPDNPNLDPEFTEYQQQQFALGTTPSQISAINSSSLYDLYGNLAGKPPNQTKQSRIFLYFYALWKARAIFTVETPYGFLSDMAILTFRAAQDEETKSKSSYTITFKKLRFSGAAAVAAGQLAGRVAYQMSEVTQNGNAGTTPVTPAARQSLLYRTTQGP